MESKKNAYIMTAFYHALGLFEYKICNSYVSVRGLIKSRGYHFGIHASLHVSDLFWTFVNEQNDEIDLGVIEANRIGYILEKGCLSSFGLRNNHASLSLSNGGKQVHQPRAHRTSSCAQVEPFLWEKWCQKFEWHPVFNPFGRAPIDAFDVHKRVIFLANSRRANSSDHGITRLKTKLLELLGRDVDIVGRVQVVIVSRAQKCISFGLHFNDALSLDQPVKIKSMLFGFR